MRRLEGRGLRLRLATPTASSGPPLPARRGGHEGRVVAESLLNPKEEIPGAIYIGVSAAVGIALFGLWCVLSYGGLVRTDFLATPHAVLLAGYEGLRDVSLLKHIRVSLTVILAGFFLSSIIAVPLGILMGSFRIVQAAVEPVTNFMRYLPVSALIPLLILWIGIGIEEKIAVIFLGTFFQQIMLFADVSARVSKDLIDVSYTLGAKRRQVVYRVLFPACMPGVVDNLRVTMGWAWTYLVVAELVAANSGLGYMILTAMRGLFTDVILLGIFVIGLLGLITDQIFKLARRVLLPWAAEG
ncbi:MAG: ABC transporter permease [Proteobacteria bacterium]|nr:ABC transporter permease [Pseudomonadota bacterium]